jgi:ankyrin repeat protein
LLQALKPQGQKLCLNKKNIKGETPLLIASKFEKLENIKCLIQYGMNLNHEAENLPGLDSTSCNNDKLKIIENSRDISHKVSVIHFVCNDFIIRIIASVKYFIEAIERIQVTRLLGVVTQFKSTAFGCFRLQSNCFLLL